MTASPAGIELSAAAEARLAAYLDQVRAVLTRTPEVSADEIAADVREHIEHELVGTARPVGLGDLEAVLGRLGPPSGWVPSSRGAAPAAGSGFPGIRPYLRERWRVAREVLWRGPHDWRLAYLAFGLFALGVLAFPLFPLFLVLSYVLARAGLAAAREQGVEVGPARGWLLYPPVALVSTVLLLAVVAVPFGATAAVVAMTQDADHHQRWERAGRPDNPQYRTFYPTAGLWGRGELRTRFPDATTTQDRLLGVFPGPEDVREVLGVGFVGAGVFALWGAVVGLLAGAFPGAVRAVFVPYFAGSDGTTARRVGVLCVLLVAIWGGVSDRILTEAGVV
ncbi:MAG: hypothetical protein K2X87_01140 [Gemmataceae bacterium]|nr:hypothetical protein [Gemmataceae bacterium]